MAEGTTAKKRQVFIDWEEDAGQTLIFDATISEMHDSTADLSDHPVEGGADFTDHIRRTPDSIELEGIVTDDPLVIDRSTNAEEASTGGDPDQRAVSAYSWLMQAKDDAKLLRVYTRLRRYRNMAITGISVKRDAGESRIIRVRLSLREIMIAVTEQVEAPTPALKAAPARRKKSKKGKKTKKEESDANKNKARSISSNLLGDQLTGALSGGAGNLQGI